MRYEKNEINIFSFFLLHGLWTRVHNKSEQPAGYWWKDRAETSGMYQAQICSAWLPCMSWKKFAMSSSRLVTFFLRSQVDSVDCTTEQVHLSTIYKVDSKQLTRHIIFKNLFCILQQQISVRTSLPPIHTIQYASAFRCQPCRYRGARQGKIWAWGEGTKQRTSDLDKSQKLQLQLLLSANNPQVSRTCRVMLKAI
jgi:hypothetical protein